jgi:hypothetical protein
MICKNWGTDRCPNKPLLEEKDKELNRILRSYRKDKKYYRRLLKIALITGAILVAVILLIVIFGPEEGVKFSISNIFKIFGK